MDDASSIAELLSALDEPFTGERLFDQLPDIVFFIKDRGGRYIAVNQTLVARCGMTDKGQLLGRTPESLMPASLGHTFANQDRQILRSGEPLLGQLELHVHASGNVGWCLTTKLPLRNRDGVVIGLVGVSQDLRLPDPFGDAYRHVAAAVSFAERSLRIPPTVGRMADVARMSRYQLDRRMQRVFGLTTGQWLLKQRIDLAQSRLRETADSITQIASAAGYRDASAFARQFRAATGLSPRDYRQSARPRDH